MPKKYPLFLKSIPLLIILALFVKTSFGNQTSFNNSNPQEKDYLFEKNTLKKINIFEAIDIALSRNPDTKILWLSIKTQSTNLGIAKSDYWPDITLGASQQKQWLDSFGNSTNSSQASLSLSWLLYDFGQREANISQEKFNLEHLKQKYLHSLQQTIYQVIETYCRLFSAKEALKSALKSEESYKKAYELAQEKYFLGLVPKADVLKSKTQAMQSQLNRQKTANLSLVYQGQLIKLLNYRQTTKIKLTKPNLIKKSSLASKDIETLIQKSLKDRADLKALIAAEKSSKAAAKNADLSQLPSLSFFSNQGLSRNYQNNTNKKELSLGLRFSLPLFTGFRQTYESEKTSYHYQSAREERKKLEKEAAYETWEAYHNLKTAQKNSEVAVQMQKSARENQNVTTGMYKVGKATMLDVLTAEAAWLEAENERINAEYEFMISQAALLKAIGSLNRKSINQQILEEKNESKIK